MSATPQTSKLADRLATALALDAPRAAALAQILDEELLSRLATREEIVTLAQRIEALPREIEETAKAVVDGIGEALTATPVRTADTLDKKLQGIRRSLSSEISNLHAGSWIVLLAGMLLSAVIARLL